MYICKTILCSIHVNNSYLTLLNNAFHSLQTAQEHIFY